MKPNWNGNRLYFGAVHVGSVQLDTKRARHQPEQWIPMIHMPGGRSLLTRVPSKDLAKWTVENTLALRIEAMFGHSPREIRFALKRGPDTRRAALELYEAAQQDTEADLGPFLGALARAMGLKAAKNYPEPNTEIIE